MEEDKNINSADECQSCLFERAICIQKGECLLYLLEQIKKKKFKKD